jgi:hypothetical protein
LRNKIKELEEKLNNKLALNILEGKFDIKPIKEEMNKLIYLEHEYSKRGLKNFFLKREERIGHNSISQGRNKR